MASEMIDDLRASFDIFNKIGKKPISKKDPNLFNMGNSKTSQDRIMDKMVYRVMKLEHLLKWCDEKKNVLPDVEKWDDPWERGLFSSPIECENSYVWTNNFKYYGQCWSFNKAETDATWRIFKANEGGCVRIGVKAKDLYKCLKESIGEGASISCYAGKVVYKTEPDVKKFFEKIPFSERLTSQGEALAETLFVKSKAFSHEDEFRVLYFPTKSGEGEYSLKMPQPEEGLFKYDMDVSLIKYVQIGPKISRCIHELMKNKFEFDELKKKLMEKGIKCKIGRSTIYDCPLTSVKF